MINPFEQALRDAELLLGVSLTLHDSTGIFHDVNNQPLFPPARQSHRKMIVCDAGFCDRCLKHCRGTVHQQVRESGQFVHLCWKGLREIALPMAREGRHFGVLYAGVWRDAERRNQPVPAQLPARMLAAYERLAPWPPLQAESITRVLQLLISGLLAQLDDLHALGGEPPTRRAAILQFVKYRATEPVRLADLARELHLSPSRASHLVAEIFSQSFESLITAERIRRASSLLLSTDWPVAEIGRRVGFENEYYFNRVFQRLSGAPPGRFRKKAGRAGQEVINLNPT